METIRVFVATGHPERFALLTHCLTTPSDTGTHYVLETTSDYPEILRRLVRNQYDVILLDYCLPHTNLTGIELLERANAGGCVTPVILLSPFDDHESFWAADAAGAATFLNTQHDLNTRALQLAIRHSIHSFKKLQELQDLLTNVQKQLAALGKKYRRLSGSHF